MLKKYKNFVRKLGKSGDSDESDNHWRGATDFTKLSNLDETRDEHDRYSTNKQKPKRRKQRSFRKKSNAEKRELARSLSQENVPPHFFMSQKTQHEEQQRSNLGMKDEFLKFTKKLENDLRKPVVSRRVSEVASPRGILPRTEEAFFLRCLQEIIMFEKDLEV